MTDWASIITVLIAGVFALIGAYIGSRMERKTQHQNWILEKRAETFADFLKVLNKSIEDVSLYFRQDPEKGLEREQKLLDIYYPAFDYVNIVRLFLKESERDKFDKLVREIYAIHSQKERGDTRLSLMDSKKKELQKIFEDHIKNPD
ncbi:MAG: hypothetical protein ABFR82_17510 [Nitrospirota bacterium]